MTTKASKRRVSVLIYSVTTNSVGWFSRHMHYELAVLWNLKVFILFFVLTTLCPKKEYYTKTYDMLINYIVMMLYMCYNAML